MTFRLTRFPTSLHPTMASSICSASSSNPLSILSLHPPLLSRLSSYYITRGAFSLTESEVKAAYKSASLTSHPDKGGSAEAFNKVTEARDSLLTGFAGGGEDCVSHYNSNVLGLGLYGIPGRGRSFHPRFAARVVGLTDDGVRVFWTACLATLLAVVAGFRWLRNRRAVMRAEGRARSQRREESQRRKESVILRSTLPASVSAPAVTVPVPVSGPRRPPTYSSLFEDMQSCRLLLRTLRSNTLTHDVAGLLPLALSNLGRGGKYDKVSIKGSFKKVSIRFRGGALSRRGKRSPAPQRKHRAGGRAANLTLQKTARGCVCVCVCVLFSLSP